MKKLLLALLLLVGAYSAPSFAKIISFGGEEIITVVDLPNTPEYQDPKGNNIDVGYIYKSVTILFVPIWNYDGRLVGTIEGDSSSYLNLEQSQIDEIIASAGMVRPEEPYLDFWNRFGGKILFLVVISIFGLSLYRKQSRKKAYFSHYDTEEERFRDILVNACGFLQADGAIEQLGLGEKSISVDHLLFGKLMQFIYAFAIFKVAELNPGTIEKVMNDYLDDLAQLKKDINLKSRNSVFYFLFVTDSTPSDEILNVEIKKKITKLTKGLNAFPVVLDLGSQKIYSNAATYPSKEILNNCFTKANAEV